ncbi:hypothetical protein [Rossellomorea sp. NRS-1567]|uniref:hypothetical protein n=1 Tax=Rossellomorea sp. NRS-1567 TaxID=3233901 RepID=UPI003D285AEB
MDTNQIFNLASIIINVILLMVTTGTVLFAKKNLQAIDSPRLVITNVRDKRISKEEQRLIRVNVKNFGKGIALRTYLLVKTKEKQIHLSKPLVTLEKSDEGELLVDIGLRNEVEKAFIVTHDFFNDYYKVNVDTKFDNSHLYSMVKPVKRISSRGLARIQINRWMKKAKKQGNTYPDIVEEQRRKELDDIKAQFKDMTFVPNEKEEE